MIRHNVQNHRNSPVVTSVDELLQFFFCAIEFVGGEPERGVVTPTRVPLKFADRHQFNGSHPEPFQVVEAVDDVLVGLACIKIPNEHLIDEQPILRWPLVIVIGPSKCGLIRSECRLMPTGLPIGVRWHVGPMAPGDVLVIRRVQDQLRVRIADFQGIVDEVMVAEILPRLEVVDLQPVRVAIGRLVHHRACIDGEIVEVASQVNMILAWRAEAENSAVRAEDVEAVHCALRWIHDLWGLA